MASKIQWTDETWNPVTGCTKVSPGCAHCYAEQVSLRFWAKTQPPVLVATPEGETARPRAFTDVQCHEDRLEQPLRWKRARKIFVNSMSDLFHEDVPDEFIDRVFAAMALAPQHIFQVLTKRADRMRSYLSRMTFGQSIISEPSAYKRIVEAMDMPAWLPNVHNRRREREGCASVRGRVGAVCRATVSRG
jgi:protein gp37